MARRNKKAVKNRSKAHRVVVARGRRMRARRKGRSYSPMSKKRAEAARRRLGRGMKLR